MDNLSDLISRRPGFKNQTSPQDGVVAMLEGLLLR